MAPTSSQFSREHQPSTSIKESCHVRTYLQWPSDSLHHRTHCLFRWSAIIKQSRTRPPCVQRQDLNSRINNQESARRRFQSLRLASIEAYTLSTMLHATLAVNWSNGVNVLEGLHQMLARGKSTPLDKVNTHTLIDALPPSEESAGRHCTHLRRRQRPPLPHRGARQPVLRALVDAKTVIATTPHQTRRLTGLPEAPPKRTVSSC